MPRIGDYFSVITDLEPGVAAPDLPPVFGRYKIRSLLGVGGTSLVLSCWDRTLNRDLALKIWNPDGVTFRTRRDKRFFKRFFLREAKVLASVAHRNLCEVYDFGCSRDGYPWIAMEQFATTTLRDHITAWDSAKSPFRLEQALHLFSEVLLGVAALHSHGIWRLDLKPDNVLIRGDAAKLIDVGSSITKHYWDDDLQGAAYGSPGYLAPEMFTASRKDDITPAVDFFALGVMLLELCTFNNPLNTEESRRAAFEALGLEPPLRFSAATLWADLTACTPVGHVIQTDAQLHAAHLAGLDFAAGLSEAKVAIPDPIIGMVRALTAGDPATRPTCATSVLDTLSSVLAAMNTGDVFVSHAHADKRRFVDGFVSALQANGLSVWYDSWDLNVGESFWDKIGSALQNARFVVLVLSQASLTSTAVAEELRIARLENIGRVKVLPILIDEIDFSALPPDIRARQVLRFPLPSAKKRFAVAVETLLMQMRRISEDQAG